MKFEEIKSLVQPEIDSLQIRLKEELQSNVPLMELMTDHLLKTKGKLIRPLLVFLTAKMCGESSDRTIVAATMIELLHTATLVHDDVVDEADSRRGMLSINAKWKNKAAVLLGDFMLSKGLLISLENNEIELLKIMSRAVKEMSEGELLQIEKAIKLDITEEVYYDIIYKKTASLISTACLAGYHSVANVQIQSRQIAEMGYHIGMAFQIKDDLLDLSKNDIGKPLTKDISDQKMTLPLIYTLSQLNVMDRYKLLIRLKFNSKSQSSIQKIVQKIEEKKGIEYAQKKMIEYVDQAKKILVTFPENQYRQALMSLINFTVEREK